MTTSKSRQQRWAWLIATTCGLGEIVPAPGTLAGSFPAAVIWIIVAWLTPGLWVLLAATLSLSVVATVMGMWAARIESQRRGAIDPGPVVIDEVAGQWITYFVALPMTGVLDGVQLLLFVAAGFFLFRAADVIKPWPICLLERLPGALGIMSDDIAAGVLAGAVLGVGWLLAF
ncbi:MAG: phosphatidylglycerophosphatase A [bacterium]|nr:phosphatidylglycerophosphatase A [bacterium]